MRKVCQALVGVMLLAQLAVSAYACPGLASAASMGAPTDAAMAAAAADAAADPHTAACADMAGGMDPDLANLCAEHCHPGQPGGQVAALSVPAALLTALYVTPLAPEPAVAPRPAADTPSALAAASPPLAILHCCFRI